MELVLLSFKYKFLIKNLWECKGFSTRRLLKQFCNKNRKKYSSHNSQAYSRLVVEKKYCSN